MKAKDVYGGMDTPTVYIRYKGIWDMQDLYQSMVDYFRRKKYKFYERVYKHKHPSPFGIERQYMWRATRKESEYLQFQIDIYYHTYDAHDIEVVMADSTKKTFTKGRIWMEFTGKVIYDWEKRWQDNVFYAELKNFFDKYIIRKKMEHMWWDQLWYREIHKLHEIVKEKLKMESQEYEHRFWTGVHE
ncbi:hypothetical protein KY360_05470 [Candidatus Woesearchaeota archaeon]|nr:hypothetical protein [Candidatus Woesearchaeota archaeon]